MPIDERTVYFIAVMFLLGILAYLGYAFYILLEIFAYHHKFKSLCRSIEQILISFSSNHKFENAMTEIDHTILTIVKSDKHFPKTCHSIGGLLLQYIYWINTDRARLKLNERTPTEIKETAHELITLYKTTPFSSESDLNDEPLLNTIAQSIDKKDLVSAQKYILELDQKISKERKKDKFLQYHLPTIASIVSAIISALLTSLLS